MSVVLDAGSTLNDALTDMNHVLDAAMTADLATLDRDDLLAAWRDLERARSRLAALEHRLVAEADARSLGYELGAKTTPGLMRQVLRITAAEAGGRVRAAHDAGPRRTVTGEAVAPVFPRVAAAQAAGTISPRHAYVITTAIKAVPDEILDQVIDDGEHAGQLAYDVLEAAFVAEAEHSDPAQLARRAREVLDHLDPDGKFKDSDYRQRRRDVRTTKRADGSGRVTIEATAELMELLDVVFDSLAAPQPTADGGRDPRTAGQRCHDALTNALHHALSAGVPDAGGCPATLVVHLDTDSYLRGEGLARTGHGRLVPVPDALQWAGGDPRVLAVALNDLHEVTHFSGTHRLFTANQRRAMAARDRGCTFPGCDTPAAWCEAMHITDYATTRRTSIDDGGLGCRHHHRQADKQGWRTTMINGRPHWIPPSWLDPTQNPVRNTTFDDAPNPLQRR